MLVLSKYDSYCVRDIEPKLTLTRATAHGIQHLIRLDVIVMLKAASLLSIYFSVKGSQCLLWNWNERPSAKFMEKVLMGRI
jgi:hypothetical protein